MSKHSPAPWERMIFDDKTYVVDSNDVLVMLYRNPDPQMNDNAQLIAAAPELLEALKLAETSMLDSGYNPQSSTIMVVKAAINKAIGEQP